MTGIPITKAAKALRKTPKTIRCWIQQGAPCERPGEVGRHGGLVDLEALRQWRADRAVPGLTLHAQQVQLEQLAESLWRCLRSDSIAAKIGVSERDAAGFLLLVYERVAKDYAREAVDLRDLPARMKQLCSISTD